VVKLAGHERLFHRGPARVFDSEEACFAAVKARSIAPGDVIVSDKDATASDPKDYWIVSGTSFAAPIVARRAAHELVAPHPGASADLVQRLASEAIDLGRPGRDTRYGYGLLVPQD